MQLMRDYYSVRRTTPLAGAYWSDVKVDPDGRERRRDSEEERQQYLSDISEELAFANFLPIGSVLDFGAGLGWFLSAMRTGWNRHAIEIDLMAKSRLNATHGIWCLDSFRDCRSSFYDLVICHHVIEHCSDPEFVMAELTRCLKSGAWLIFATPDFDSPCAKRFGAHYRMLHDLTHVSLFTRSSAERFLTDHGFHIRDVRFPFPERYATAENFARWNDTSKMSPPWPGNWMTFYAQLR